MFTAFPVWYHVTTGHVEYYNNMRVHILYSMMTRITVFRVHK